MATDTSGRRVRRTFPDEFKAGAVRMVLAEGKTVGQVARDLDLTETASATLNVKHVGAIAIKGRPRLRP